MTDDVHIYACTDFLRPGTNDPMPGLIGKAYADMGGTVNYVGKPHPAVYQACFEALASSDQVSEQVQHRRTIASASVRLWGGETAAVIHTGIQQYVEVATGLSYPQTAPMYASACTPRAPVECNVKQSEYGSSGRVLWR